MTRQILAFFTVLLLIWPSVSWAAWAFVQKLENAVTGSSATSINAGSATFTSGNLIVVCGTSGGGGVTPTFTDNQGTPNTYTTVGSVLHDVGNGEMMAMAYAKNVAGGTYTVRMDLGVSEDYRRIVIAEYSGIDTTNALDDGAVSAQPATATTGTDNAAGASVTTTSANDLIVLCSMVTSAAPTTLSAGTNYTARDTLPASDGFIYEDRSIAAVGATSPTYTVDSSVSFLATSAAFTTAGGGGGGAVTNYFRLRVQP